MFFLEFQKPSVVVPNKTCLVHCIHQKHIHFALVVVSFAATTMSSDPPSTLSTPVLVIGAGPTGLIAALNLAQHGVECVLVDRSESVEEWPKMDLTNRRSMELLRRMGVVREVRGGGMFSACRVIFGRGLAEGCGRGGRASFVRCFV